MYIYYIACQWSHESKHSLSENQKVPGPLQDKKTPDPDVYS